MSVLDRHPLMARSSDPLRVKLTNDDDFKTTLDRCRGHQLPAAKPARNWAGVLPTAFAHILRQTGKSVHERTRHLDLSRRALGAELFVPAHHRTDIVRIMMRLSASMGDCRTRDWSARRVVICALYLLAVDEPMDGTGGSVLRLVRSRGDPGDQDETT